MSERRVSKLAIVGAGIGGLTAANALRLQGFDVEVYEQAPELTEVGAGVSLGPNGIRLLDRLGFGSEVERLGGRLGPGSQYLRYDGKPIAPIVTADSQSQYWATGLHRADLVEILTDPLPSEMIHTDHRCVGFEQSKESAQISFANGKTVEADVVVGADGIHSTLASFVTEPPEPIYSGQVAYRGLVPHSALPECPNDACLIWMGEGKHFLTFPVRGGALINYVGFVSSDESMVESWSTQTDVSVLESEFSSWNPLIAQMISKIDKIFGWGVYDRLPLERWSNGRLTLLGDAAHPMLPHLGQGANQSIEDGVALARLLALSPADPTGALEAYATFRRRRTSEIQGRSRKTGQQYDSQADLDKRDAEIIAAAGRHFRSLYDYDALKEVEKYAAAL